MSQKNIQENHEGDHSSRMILKQDNTPKNNEDGAQEKQEVRFGFNDNSNNVSPRPEAIKKDDLSQNRDDVSNISELRSESHRGDRDEPQKRSERSGDGEEHTAQGHTNGMLVEEAKQSEEDPLKHPPGQDDSENITPPPEVHQVQRPTVQTQGLTNQRAFQGDQENRISYEDDSPDIVAAKRRGSRRKTMEQIQTTIDITKRFDEKSDTKNAALKKILDNPVFEKIMLILTFYALFADDYRLLFSPKETDLVWDVITILVIVAFTFEILISVFAKLNYFLSYFFWLDIVSTASLFLDIILIKNIIIRAGNNSAFGVTGLAKIIRLVRLFRLIRISKIFKSFSKTDDSGKKKKKKVNQRDSKVGKRMSELATKKIIITIFLMLIILPLFNAEFYLSSSQGVRAMCNQVRILLASSNYTTKVSNWDLLDYDKDTINADHTDQAGTLKYYVQREIGVFKKQTGKIVRVKLPGTTHNYYESWDFDEYRLEELNLIDCKMSPFGSVVVEQKNKNESDIEAILNIFRTIFVSSLLLGGSLLFGIDVYRLVINPIESMIEKVQEVIFRPMKVKELAMIEQEEQEAKLLENHHDDISEDEDEHNNNKEEKLETYIIEDAIKKIGILLGIGLGEAGKELITNYLGSEGEVDIMQPGSKIDAVFGFCDIRNFTDVTEVLQQGVMQFVNKIADIVHTICDKCLGAANKNIGDAFLLVWKQPNWAGRKRLSEFEREIVITGINDLAFFCFLKIFAEINRNHMLIEYVENQKIHQRVGAGYKVRMGFGLHYGWAIEGAIGSHHKVDVSYLSPNVNMSARLEAATKQYGVPILLSGEFIDLLSPQMRVYVRQIDCVNVKGSIKPLRLYTPMITDKAIRFPKAEAMTLFRQPTKECYIFKKMLKSIMKQHKPIGFTVFENDYDIPLLTCFNNNEFVENYQIVIQHYLDGNWEECRKYLTIALEQDPKDGPANNLSEYIGSLDDQAPKGWQGVRGLTEK